MCWTARVQELPGCEAHEPTSEEAAHAISSAMEAWLDTALKEGTEIPEPRRPSTHSGRLLLRMPQELHAEMARRAESEEVSLNVYITSVLAGTVGWPQRPRAQRRRERVGRRVGWKGSTWASPLPLGCHRGEHRRPGRCGDRGCGTARQRLAERLIANGKRRNHGQDAVLRLTRVSPSNLLARVCEALSSAVVLGALVSLVAAGLAFGAAIAAAQGSSPAPDAAPGSAPGPDPAPSAAPSGSQAATPAPAPVQTSAAPAPSSGTSGSGTATSAPSVTGPAAPTTSDQSAGAQSGAALPNDTLPVSRRRSERRKRAAARERRVRAARRRQAVALLHRRQRQALAANARFDASAVRELVSLGAPTHAVSPDIELAALALLLFGVASAAFLGLVLRVETPRGWT